MKFTLVIPCYNEARSLPRLVERIETVFTHADHEVVLVDNGSTDDTPNVLASLAKRPDRRWRSIRVEVNEGYGNGIVAGLRVAEGEVLGWTHADLQADPADALRGLALFETHPAPATLFVKGLRYGRGIADTFFTAGMSVFETLLMRAPMRDINAQPTMFHRDFFNHLGKTPDDFSLDLYFYFMAVNRQSEVKRFPVLFSSRIFGSSHWNIGFWARVRFIRRTITYSLVLRREMKLENRK